MSAIDVIIRLLLVLLLISYLVIKQRQRERVRPIEPRDRANWTGNGIDTSRLRPRIEQVRGNYLAGPRAAVHDLRYRQRLLASIGRTISQSSFLQKKKSEEEDAHGEVRS